MTTPTERIDQMLATYEKLNREANDLLDFATAELVIRDILECVDVTEHFVVDLKRVLDLNESACKLLHELLGRIIDADFGISYEGNALFGHQIDAPLDDLPLIKLHVRDAVHEQAANPVRPLQHSYPMASSVQLRGGA